MKKVLYIIRPFIFIAIGIVFAVASAFFSASAVSPTQNNAANAVSALQAAATPTQVDNSVIGSTDGITIMSFVIVLIIILPIFFRREFWKS